MPLVRAPVNGKLAGLITAAQPVFAPTHWFGGRTVPCTEPECTACNEHRPTRWHAYITIWTPQTNTQILLELPEAASHRLSELSDVHGKLRGGRLAVFRNGNRQNSRVIINFWPNDATQYRLPKEPNIRNILEHIWQLDRQPQKINGQPARPAIQLRKP